MTNDPKKTEPDNSTPSHSLIFSKKQMLIGGVVAVVFAGCSWAYLSQHATEPQQPQKKFTVDDATPQTDTARKGLVVYAIKDIYEGQVISSDDLEEKEIDLAKIPQDSLTSRTLAVGRIAKYGISQGQIISRYDVASKTNP